MVFPIDNLKPEQHSTIRDVVNSFKNMFSLTPAASAQEEAGLTLSPLSPEARTLYTIKADILMQVRDAAAATIDPATGKPANPTLEQYRLATEAFAMTEKGKAMVEARQWNPSVAADLKNQDLSGFTLSEPKRAVGSHYLDEVKELDAEAKADPRYDSSVVQANHDLHDRDSNGKMDLKALHEFYDHISFNSANLEGAFVEPATSFNEEIAKANNLKGMTFNGMSDGDTFTFGAGQYDHIHMTNVNGGEIVFASNSQVDGIHIAGKEAKITVGDNAAAKDITVSDNFRIITLKMGKNSVLSHSDLREATFDMGSQCEPGAILQDVQLSANVKGLDFSGVKLNNVTIDGEPIKNTQQLHDLDIKYDHHTKIHTSHELSPKAELSQLPNSLESVAAIGAALKASQETIGNPMEPNAIVAQEAMNAAREAAREAARAKHTTASLPPLPGRQS